jgi:hypothetical protein
VTRDRTCTRWPVETQRGVAAAAEWSQVAGVADACQGKIGECKAHIVRQDTCAGRGRASAFACNDTIVVGGAWGGGGAGSRRCRVPLHVVAAEHCTHVGTVPNHPAPLLQALQVDPCVQVYKHGPMERRSAQRWKDKRRVFSPVARKARAHPERVNCPLAVARHRIGELRNKRASQAEALKDKDLLGMLLPRTSWNTSTGQ